MVREFYGDVLPDTGYYCLTILPAGTHIWAETLDELTELTAERIDRSGLYFGTASFQSFANRKQSNVLGLKSLRLDIDAGPEKLAKHGPGAVYATQKDALRASVAFFRASGLMPTYVVSSGAGLHIYYCMTESVEPGLWLGMSKGLSALGAKHGLKIDPSVTEDSARILRVPGAPHPNGERVKVLQRTGVFHEPSELMSKLGAVAAPVRPSRGINDDLEFDLAFQGPPSSAVKIAQHCGALREVAASKGDVPEPHWRAMIGLVKRTVEGLDIAQEWSSGYDGYNEAEVERKFNNWSTGPTTCNEFSKHSSACQSCPHWGKIKSPIALGLMTVVEIETLPVEAQTILAPLAVQAPTGDIWDGSIPAGFSVEKTDGGAYYLQQRVKDKIESATGDEVPVDKSIPFTTSIWWFSQWAEAEGSDDNAQVVLHLWVGGFNTKVYTMDQALIASPAKLLEFLSGKAIHTTHHKKAGQAMQDYAKAQIQHIHASRKNLKISDHMGLRTLDDGTLVASQGRYTIFPDGTVRDTMLSPALRSMANCFDVPLPPGADVWGPEVWDDHIRPRAERYVEFIKKFYGAPGMERFQLAIMLGLASPFMAFVTGEYAGGAELPNNSSLTVSLFSQETARGKTTAAQASIMAYGRPGKLTNDSGTSGATVNGRLGALSMHGTLPSVMDEMTDLNPTAVATTVSTVANGAGKRTMTSQRTLRQESTWALINIITTNVSQQDMVTAARASAGPVLYRMLEINVDDMPEYDIDQREAFRLEWAEVNRECVGALGAMIHREICALGLNTCSQLVTKCVTKAEQYVLASQSARFQSRGLGAMIALDVVLRKLGLTMFDTRTVMETFKTAHNNNVEYVTENTAAIDPLQQLASALIDLAPFTLVTEGERDGGARHDRPLNLRVPDVVHGRHITSSGITYLSAEGLRDWCQKKGISVRPITAAAMKAGIIQGTKARVNGIEVLRTSSMRTLTKGLVGDMHLVCPAYTILTRKLRAHMRVDGGLHMVPELIDGAPKVAPLSDEPEEPTGTDA